MVAPLEDIALHMGANHVYSAWIEIPKGSKVKYETDKQGFLFMDRVLFSSTVYPYNYGFLPQTLGGDGDPLDVMVIMQEPVVPNCYMRVRVVGVLHMEDQGERDEKILAVPTSCPNMKNVHDILHLNQHILKEIWSFFEDYKKNEGKDVSVHRWGDAQEAICLVEECHNLWRQT